MHRCASECSALTNRDRDRVRSGVMPRKKKNAACRPKPAPPPAPVPPQPPVYVPPYESHPRDGSLTIAGARKWLNDYRSSTARGRSLTSAYRSSSDPLKSDIASIEAAINAVIHPFGGHRFNDVLKIVSGAIPSIPPIFLNIVVAYCGVFCGYATQPVGPPTGLLVLRAPPLCAVDYVLVHRAQHTPRHLELTVGQNIRIVALTHRAHPQPLSPKPIRNETLRFDDPHGAGGGVGDPIDLRLRTFEELRIGGWEVSFQCRA